MNFMLMVNYHNKVFKTKNNSDNGETSNDTLFYYKQIGNIVHAEYFGGMIKYGQLMGIVSEYGTIEMNYHHINQDGNIRTGICESIPEILSNGKIRLHEKWQWTNGDLSSGKSIIEEE